MNTEDLGNVKILNILFKPAGMMMENRLRQWLMNPRDTLRAADIQPGQTILEVGCGTGFFTLPAAEMIGDRGHLVAMDPLLDFTRRVSDKIQEAGLENVVVARRDALDTRLGTASIDKVLLLGVLPYPVLPLNRILPEMHRVLKPGGTMAVWLFPPVVHFWVPRSIATSGLFANINKYKGVYNFLRN